MSLLSEILMRHHLRFVLRENNLLLRENNPINSCISATVSEIPITAHTVFRFFKIAKSVIINQLST